MVMPLGDDNSDLQSRPLVNYVMIALNVLVFVIFQGMGQNDDFTYKFSTVPAEIRTGEDVVTDDRVIVDPQTNQKIRAPGLRPTPVSVYLTLLTSMFMHGGLAHLEDADDAIVADPVFAGRGGSGRHGRSSAMGPRAVGSGRGPGRTACQDYRTGW